MSNEPRKRKEMAFTNVERKDRSPFWRKLFSSNWWWYGEVNPDSSTLPALDKRPRLWRSRMWIGFLVCLLGVFAPTISSLANYNIPQKKDMQTIYGEVISTNIRSPHMQIRLPSGEVIDAEFPVFITYFGGIQSNFFKEPVHKLVMTCKQVVASGTYLRLVPLRRFRIWNFGCMNGAFVEPWNEIQRDWLNNRMKTHVAISAFCFFGFLLILIERFLRERKDYALKS
jgi:hypothetical protein